MKKVRLDDIALAIGSDASEGSWYLDTETGITMMVTDNVMEAVLRQMDIEADMPDDIKTMFKQAREIIADQDSRFYKLPGRLDVLEWDIMRRFALNCEDAAVGKSLMESIQGTTAFSAFQKAVRKHKVAQQWAIFREHALRKVAIEWCVEHQIHFEQ